jgi:hypothetical protein
VKQAVPFLDSRRAAMTRVRRAFAALCSSLALLALPAPVQPGDEPFACLVGVPSWGTGEEEPLPTPRSFAALEALAESLQAAGVTLIRTSDRETPLEAMAEVVDLNAAALLVGVRSLDPDPECVAVHVPSAPRRPRAAPVGEGPRDLDRAIRQADAVERARLSRNAAAHLASVVPTCPVPPDEWVDYFLTVSRGPTIVVELRSVEGDGTRGSEGSAPEELLQGVSEGIGRFLGEPPHNKWRHQRKRFD